MRARLGMAAALALGCGTAHAAPIDFECDSPPNRESLVEQAVPGPAATISGKVSFVLTRGGRFAPTSAIRLGSGDGKTAALLQMIGSVPLTYNGAPATDPRYEVVLLAKTPAGATSTKLGKLDPASTDLPFTLTVGADGAVSASVGALSGKTKLAPLVGPKARLLCSSGQFTYKSVEAR